MIQLHHIEKKFWEGTQQVQIFSNLNLEIHDGEFMALIWPSGSWKSTFLNMISWIDRQFQWQLKIQGKDISEFSDDEMTVFRWENISYIFQNFKLIENLTVAENIDLIVDLNKLERNFSTEEILEIVGLTDKKDVYVFHLSWWESQRVAIARAFVGKTSILLADEPTGALDMKNKKIIMDLIVSLHHKVKNTIVMITHDYEVAKLANTIYKMSDLSLVEIIEKWEEK